MPGLASTALVTTPLASGPTAPGLVPSPDSRMRRVNRDGNFDQNEDGTFVTEDGVAHRVRLAVATVIGSAGADTGLGMQQIRKIGTRFDAELSANINRALLALVTENTIRITSINSERLGVEGYLAHVDYVNLRTGEENRVTL